MTQSESNLKDDLNDGGSAESKGPQTVDELSKITSALNTRFEGGKVTALAEGGKVLLMIQDAPDELRRLADEMERIGVSEIKAFVAYARPTQKELSVPSKNDARKDSLKSQETSPKESTT